MAGFNFIKDKLMQYQSGSKTKDEKSELLNAFKNKLITPEEFIQKSEEISLKYSNKKFSGRSVDSETDNYENSFTYKQETSLVKEFDKIQIGGDVENICSQLDKVLSLAKKAQMKNIESGLFETKIRSGIMRLQKLNAFDEAAFYETEVIRLQKDSHNKNMLLLYLFIFCIVGLVMFIIFGDKLLSDSLRVYKKVIDTTIKYFK